MMNRECFFSVPKIDLSVPLVRILSHDNLYTKFAAYYGEVYYISSQSMSYRRFGDNYTGQQAYNFQLKRILKRAMKIESLAKDHSRAYSQTLYTIELLRKQPKKGSIALDQMEAAITKGGFPLLSYIKMKKISGGRKIKNISRKLIILFGIYKKFLILDF